ISIKITEVSRDRSDRPNFPRPDEVDSLAPLWMSANHEGLLDFHAGTVTRPQKRYGLRHREADRLFAEDMFSGFGGLDRPGYVKMIGKRIVNGLDFRVSQKLLIRPESLTDS